MRRPTNFKLGRRTEPRFAKVTTLIYIFIHQNGSAQRENTNKKQYKKYAQGKMVRYKNYAPQSRLKLSEWSSMGLGL